MACESAEACFQRAASFSDEHPDRVRLQVDRFRHVQEAYPGTLWARRAGFRIGWSLLEREPARAIEYLRAAPQGFPTPRRLRLVETRSGLGAYGFLS